MPEARAEQIEASLSRIAAWRRRTFWFVLAHVGAFVALFVSASGTSYALLYLLAVFELAFGTTVYAVLWVRLLLFRCPRCSERFFFRAMSSVGVLGGRCVHCGLPLKRVLGDE